MLVGVTPLRLFVLAVAGQFIFGIVLALPGTLFGLPGWTGTLGFDVPAQANLLVVFFACQCVWTGVAGRGIDRFGCERVLAVGTAIVCVGFGCLAMADRIATTSLAAALLASGGAAINASSNTMVSSAYGERRGAMLSRMAVFGAAGALMTPLMFAAASAAGVASRSWQLAGVGAFVVVASLTMKVHPHHRIQHPPGQLRRLLRDRWILGVIVLLSLEFGTEAVFAGWSAAYAIAIVPGAPPEVVIALYWGGICLGRALAPIALARTTQRRMVIAGASVAAIAALVMTGASGVLTLLASIFVVGLALGPLAPTIVSLAGDRHPQQMGTVIGLLLSAGQVGSTVLPWCAGQAAVASGFRLAMLVPAIAITLVAAGTLLVQTKRPASVRVPATREPRQGLVRLRREAASARPRRNPE